VFSFKLNYPFIGTLRRIQRQSSDSEDNCTEEREATGPLFVRRNNKPWEAQEPLSKQKISWVLMCLLQGMKDLTAFHRRSQHLHRMPSNPESDEENDFPMTTDEDFDVIEERLANRHFKEAMVIESQNLSIYYILTLF
jgi:hypothetical protein